MALPKYQALSAEQFTEACTSISKTEATLFQKIQVAAVDAIRVSIQDRNISRMNQLLDACNSKVARKDALVAFFEQHGQCAYSKQEKVMKFYEVKDIKFEAQELLGTPWTSAKREPEPVSIYDVEAAFSKWMKNVDKMCKANGVEIRHGELVNDLQTTLRAYNARQYIAAEASPAG